MLMGLFPEATEIKQWKLSGGSVQPSITVTATQAASRGRRRYRMIVCSVLGKAFKVEGHLKCKDAMHDVVNVRALCDEDLHAMVEPCCAPGHCGGDSRAGASAYVPA